MISFQSSQRTSNLRSKHRFNCFFLSTRFEPLSPTVCSEETVTDPMFVSNTSRVTNWPHYNLNNINVYKLHYLPKPWRKIRRTHKCLKNPQYCFLLPLKIVLTFEPEFGGEPDSGHRERALRQPSLGLGIDHLQIELGREQLLAVVEVSSGAVFASHRRESWILFQPHNKFNTRIRSLTATAAAAAGAGEQLLCGVSTKVENQVAKEGAALFCQNESAQLRSPAR